MSNNLDKQYQDLLQTILDNGVANGDRGFIDALSRETLAASGMTFELPRINTAPTVALTNEEGAPTAKAFKQAKKTAKE